MDILKKLEKIKSEDNKQIIQEAIEEIQKLRIKDFYEKHKLIEKFFIKN